MKKRNKKPKQKTVGWSDDSDDETKDEDKDDDNDEENLSLQSDHESYIECASIGQAFCGLTKYEDAVNFINNEGYNEKIISYVRILFDWYNSAKLTKNESETKAIAFEQYIGPYIICLANLTHKSVFNKQAFSNYNLFQLLLSFWNKIHVSNNNANFLDKNNNNSFLNQNNNNLKKAPGDAQGEFLTSSFNFEIEKSFLSTVSFDEEKSHFIDEGSVVAPTIGNNKQNQSNANEPRFAPLLIKNLKLAVIECMGKVLSMNTPLKEKYVYTYDFTSSTMSFTNDNPQTDMDWPKVTNVFIKTLIGYLDTMTIPDRDIQLEVLRFIALLCDSDPEMQNRFVTPQNVYTSTLINNFRNLLRKSSPLNIRTSAMFSLWTLSGDKDFRGSHDRKTVIYRAIGAQKVVYNEFLFEKAILTFV